MNDDNHVDVFEQIMQDYNFMLSMDQWATGDLVNLANLIDIELQVRADNALIAENIGAPPSEVDHWDEYFGGTD